MSYRRPLFRPVTCSSRTAESSGPCSGERSSKRTTGLLILIRMLGGTFRSTALVIWYHLPRTSLPAGSVAGQGPWSPVQAVGWGSLAPGGAVPVGHEGAGVVGG